MTFGFPKVKWPQYTGEGAHVEAIDVKFSQDLTHQKSLKSINFWESYLKNNNVDVFLTHSVYGQRIKLPATVDVVYQSGASSSPSSSLSSCSHPQIMHRLLTFSTVIKPASSQSLSFHSQRAAVSVLIGPCCPALCCMYTCLCCRISLSK